MYYLNYICFVDKAVGKMDNHYASIEDRHSKIIDNVEDIQKAINFVSEVSYCIVLYCFVLYCTVLY